jgi:Ca-activated chloride channel family protein
MRGPLAASIVGAFFAATGASVTDQTPRFRAGTQTVSVFANAFENGGQIVRGLTRDDFEVKDDGVPQELTAFSNDIQPISMAVMLDMSNSMTSSLPLLRTGAAQLFNELLPADQVKLGSFANRITISRDFTNDRDALIRALYLDLPQGGETALWSAIATGMTHLSKTTGRRVVLVFTDGYDTMQGRPNLNDVLSRAQSEEFMIYGIGLRGLSRDGLYRSEPPDPGLQVLAALSGGGYFELSSANDLGEKFKRVADELHQQYLLGFQTLATDGKVHQLEVTVKKPGVTARARKSYVAPKAGVPSTPLRAGAAREAR